MEREIQQHEAKTEQLEQQLQEALAQLAKLEAQLETTPGPTAVPAKVVHLPNPRPAPKDAAPLTFICREGRIIPMDVDGLVDRTQKLITYVIRRGRLDRNPAAGIDCGKILEGFEKNGIRDSFFEVGLQVRGSYLFMDLNRRPGAGDTTEQLARSGSRYRDIIGRIRSSQNYVRFLVWPDSFETYLAARQIASERGIPAGWDPQTTTGEYVIRLPGKLRCGPPPKPAPKPPPGTPKPQPKPAPTPAPPPSDEID
jgi:ribosomal protein S18